MDCKIFRKRLNDLIEDNISYDLKDSMLEHIEKCEACKIAYEEELFVEESFRAALSVDLGEFRSIRADVMKSIDKNRYSNSPMKRLYFHLKKYRTTYTSMVALAAGLVLVTPYIKENGFNFMAAKKSEVAPQSSISMKAEIAPAAGANNFTTADNARSFNENNAMMAKEIPYIPVLQKKDADKNYTPKFNTPWQNSKSKTYSATVEGKGQDAQEEGIATIVVKDTKTSAKWIFELIDNDAKQFTPKAVKWIDDQNLLVIIGYGYGTVDIGGDLYILNINDSSVIKADQQNILNIDKYNQVTKIVSVKPLQSGEQEVKVEMLIYNDDLFIESRTETKAITIITPIS